MGGQKSGRRSARSRQVEGLSNTSTFSGGARISRASLLAGASLVAIGALAAPDRALAACSGLDQIISTSKMGPVFSDGGAITVTGTGSISGDPDGVDALTCAITTLTNQSGGTISGGNGFSGGFTGGAGGSGVSSVSTITTLTNSGTIRGGNGGSGTSRAARAARACRTPGRSRPCPTAARNGGDGFSPNYIDGTGGAGGAAVSNAQGATIGSLSNRADWNDQRRKRRLRHPARRRGRHGRLERRDNRDTVQQRRD